MPTSTPINQDIFQSNIQKFFTIYESFLLVDSIVSLSTDGRNRTIISNFMYAYLQINKEKSTQQKDLLRKLVEDVAIYAKSFEHISVTLNFNEQKHIPFIAKTSSKLGESINKFLSAASQYKKHREKLASSDIQDLYIRSNTSYQIAYFKTPIDGFSDCLKDKVTHLSPDVVGVAILKQSLMEFNNALSHLHSAYRNRHPDKNIQRAVKHIDRATLDFYKAIVRDLWTLKKVDQHIDAIKKVRELEYMAIGDDDNKHKIVSKYADLISTLLG